MKKPRTLRFRIAFYFCGYLTVLLAIYSFGLIGMIKLSEDFTFERQLSEIADRVVRHVEKHGTIPDILPMHISVYKRLADVPPIFKEYVGGHEPGVFEIGPDDLNVHAAIVPVSSTGETLYFFYDVASMETSEQAEFFLRIAVGLVGLGVLFIGWILARSLSNRILDPVTALAGEVQSLSPEEGSQVVSSAAASDEVGTLAKTINQLLTRISEFSRREREFTSHASHELRTPVTVIKGAVDILKGRIDAEDRPMQRPLDRIERAATDMEMLVETFLVLARQDKRPDRDETFDLLPVVEQVVASHRYLLEGKLVEVEVRSEGACVVKAPPSMAMIALGNLVRNAFRYTLQGKIEIVVRGDRLSVIDSGPGMDSSRIGAGLGLTIVERICESTDWRFSISGETGEGTRADLVFKSSRRDDRK